jgi:general secretion pathway protein F
VSLPLAVVYRNLAELHAAGIAWPRAVEEATGSDPRWRSAGDAMSRGTSPSAALEPLVPAIDLAGIRAGETSGRMEAVLRSLSARHEEEARRGRERRTALAYPVAVAHVAAVLMAVPDLVSGSVLGAVLWALAVLAPVYLFLALSSAARRAAERGDAGSAGWASSLRTRAAVEEADARALWALGWLHDAGVPPLEAIPLAARAGAGGRVAGDLGDAAVAVRAGSPIHTAWRRVPPTLCARLENGEVVGRLAPACFETATWLEESARHRRQRFLAVLQPAAIVVVGIVVAARVIAFWAAYYRALPL